MPRARTVRGEPMVVEYTGRQVEVTPAFRALADKKLAKLARVLHGITHAHVIVTSEKHRLIAEVAIHSPHLDLAAAEESADLVTSLSTVIEKLTRQAQHHLGKRRERKRRTPVRATALWAGVVHPETVPSAGADGRPRVIRSRRFLLRPMTVEEAALEVDRTDDGLLVFRDADTDRMNVLYRRKDGNLGLIEPEA